MSEHDPTEDEQEAVELPASEATRDSVEVYEADDGIVLYDAENPLAWLKSSQSHTVSNRV